MDKAIDKATSVVDFLIKDNPNEETERFEDIKKDANLLVITPLKIMGYLVAIFGILAMIFEVRYFNEHAEQIYVIRLSATLISIFILAILNTKFAVRFSIPLVHTLLLTIIISSGLMIYLLPQTLLVNSQIVGLIIFTSALFLSWTVKNQILVAIYYNAVFASAILLNNKAVYFLPNINESIAFVCLLSMVSIIACAYNFRMKIIIAEKSFKIELSHKKYRSIFDNSVEGIFQSTPDGRFITFNKAFAEILGYQNLDELKEIDIEDIYVNPDDRKALVSELRKKGYVKDTSIELKKQDGSSVFVRLNDKIVKDDHGNKIMQGNIQDITEQVSLEQSREKAERDLLKEKEKTEMLAQEAMRLTTLKSKFLANVSHEIRTPLNGILGYITLIEDGSYGTEEELKEFAANARHSSESLIEIVNSVLDLSKIESGKVKLDKVDFDLNEVIDRSIAILSTKIDEKGITTVKDIPEGTIHLLNGDPTKTRQIFLNLISNAIKFTKNGEIKIRVRTNMIDKSNVDIRVNIADTGTGIPANKLDSLFKPFSQIDGSEHHTMGGSGLGLVICKEYVNLMGGKISVTSEKGRGSNFKFNLIVKVQENVPVLEDVEEDHVVTASPAEPVVSDDAVRSNRLNYNILLAEDNIINQKVTTKLLQAAGYKAVAVNNGGEAVKAMKEGDYDLVLMDIQMPVVDGFSATGQIRNLSDDKKNVPIIAITAHALIGDREKCLKAGMSDYISKPIIAKDMIAMIDRLLEVNKEQKAAEPIEETVQQPIDNKSFDFERLKQVSSDDHDFEKDLLSSYIEDMELKCQELTEIVTDKDMDKILHLTHTIKGASYSVGAQLVGDEAFGIEVSAKSNDIPSVQERLPRLLNAIEETKDIVNSFLVSH
ncbi:MAG: response regulator [Ignavibacterium sp.]|nr:MAG: response regulator [Ignavibacterium sp.]